MLAVYVRDLHDVFRTPRDLVWRDLDVKKQGSGHPQHTLMHTQSFPNVYSIRHVFREHNEPMDARTLNTNDAAESVRYSQELRA